MLCSFDGRSRFLNDSLESGTLEYIPSRSFVVGGDEGGARSTCRGDSGSPVIRRRTTSDQWEAIGLVSWSRGCGRRFRPSVWTRVEVHAQWVTENMELF